MVRTTAVDSTLPRMELSSPPVSGVIRRSNLFGRRFAWITRAAAKSEMAEESRAGPGPMICGDEGPGRRFVSSTPNQGLFAGADVAGTIVVVLVRSYISLLSHLSYVAQRIEYISLGCDRAASDQRCKPERSITKTRARAAQACETRERKARRKPCYPSSASSSRPSRSAWPSTRCRRSWPRSSSLLSHMSSSTRSSATRPASPACPARPGSRSSATCGPSGPTRRRSTASGRSGTAMCTRCRWGMSLLWS